MTLSTAPEIVIAPGPSWREERRQDRLTRARIDQEREDAAAARKRADALARREDRAAARKERARRRAALAGWAAGHVTDLLFVPVIGVPGLLAWTAMAAYGRAVYGLPGLALPAFSEGSMWAFAAATSIRAREDDKRRKADPAALPRPAWHLRLGTAVFAGYGAALNFLHGLHASGLLTGIVMALVSVAGVTAHQLVTAGPRRPRRSRAARHDARIARLAARRELAARKAAVRAATAVLDGDGHARLVYRPGTAPARRGRTPAAPAPETTAAPGPHSAPAPRRTRPPGAPAARTRGGVTDEAAEVHFAAELADGRVPSKRQVKAGLHVGQDRASQIHDHLAAIAATRGQREAERNPS